MLNWWLGKSTEAAHDTNSELEPPETPAPVFAARALKSAIFGTPAPPENDVSYIYSPEKTKQTIPGRAISTMQPTNMSPVKPPGILLTPGTAAARRKTVSFGSEVVEKEVVAVKRVRGAEDDRKAGKAARFSRSASLNMALLSAKEEKPSRDVPEKPRSPSKGLTLVNLDADDEAPRSASTRSQKGSNNFTNLELMRDLMMNNEFEGDVTVDLNEPHSKSGRYWKSWHEKYHEDAQAEMKKLLRYKQLAKDYAKMKDEENIDLGEKLKEEQRRVASMEDRLTKLSARIAQITRQGSDNDEEDSPRLIKELAKQTALAVQYRKQAEEFRTALEGHDKAGGNGIPSVEEGSTHAQLLQAEVLRLQRQLTTAEKANQKLRGENDNLKQELLHADTRLGRQVEKYEKYRQSSEELRVKKDAALEQLQKTYDNLKEQAKSQRRDAEQLLKRRHEQVTDLKREIASNHNLDITVKELREALQNNTAQHTRIVAEYEIQIAELKRDVILGYESATDLRASIHRDPYLSSSLTKHQASGDSPAKSRESQIPIATQSISRPSNAISRQFRSDTPANSPPKNPQQVLSELINNANPNSIPPQRSGPVQYTPAAYRQTEILLPVPDIQILSVEPSMVSARTIHERNCRPSPRPAIINISSSPPKPARMQSTASNEIRSQNIVPGSSRLSNMEDSRLRRDISAERAAAARARIDQKNAAKRRAQDAMGKENIQN